MAEKKVVLKVDVKMAEALKDMAEYKLRVEAIDEASAGLKKRIKEEGDESGELRIKLAKLGEERKAYNKIISDSSRQIQNQITAEHTYKGALKGLTAQLAVAKDELRAMQMTDPGFAKKTAEVNVLNQKVKDLEAAYGVHTRDVGDYEKATKSLGTEMQELTDALIRMKVAGDDTSPTYQEMSNKLAQLKDAQADVNQQTTGLASDTKNLDVAMKGTMIAVTACATAMQMFDDGSEAGKRAADTMKKLQIVVTALGLATAIQNATQKQSILIQTALAVQTKATVLYTKLQAAASTQATGATAAQTIAMAALNAVMKANPIGLVLTAVVALVGGIVALTKVLGQSTKAQRAATDAQKEYERQTKQTEATLAEMEARQLENIVKVSKVRQDELAELVRNGASREAIEKKQLEMSNELRDAEISNARERRKVENQAYQEASANHAKQKAYLDELIRTKGADAKATKEQQKITEEASARMTAAWKTVNSTTKELNEKVTQYYLEQLNRREEAADKAYDKQKKLLDLWSQGPRDALALGETYFYDYSKSKEENDALRWAHEQEYAAKSFALQQDMARRALEVDRKFGKISAEEYKARQESIAANQAKFAQDQLAALEAHQRELLQAAVALAGGKDLDGQLTDVRAKYAAAYKAIREDATLEADERRFYEYRLAQREVEEIKQVRLAAAEQTGKEIVGRIDEQYKDDVRRFSESSAEQVQLEIEKQKQLIAARKAAGLDTLAEEQQLARSEAALRSAQLDSDLQLAWRNADEQYRIKREYLEKELEAAELIAERRAELEQQLTETVAAETQKKIAAVENWAGQAMNLASEVNNLMSALGDAEVQKAERNNDKEKKALEKRLKAGAISQKEYDKKVAALDADLDAKKAKIAREQAKRQKILSIFQIGIDTALAITKALATVPPPASWAMAAMSGAMAAVQLATVIATPLPMARKGGRIEGATHEQGGVLVNTENEERIISSAPAKAFPELLNLISYIGKHGGGIPETGYAMRAAIAEGSAKAAAPAPEIDYDRLAERIGMRVGDRVADRIRDLKIYTSITELHEAEKEYARIEESAKI